MTTLELLDHLRAVAPAEADAVERTWPMTLAALRAGHGDDHRVYLRVGKGRIGQEARSLGGLRLGLEREMKRDLADVLEALADD